MRKECREQTSKLLSIEAELSPGPAAHPTSLCSGVSEITREVKWPRTTHTPALTPRPEELAEPRPAGKKRAEPSCREARRSQMKTRLFLHAHPAAPWETWRDTPAGGQPPKATNQMERPHEQLQRSTVPGGLPAAGRSQLPCSDRMMLCPRDIVTPMTRE